MNIKIDLNFPFLKLDGTPSTENINEAASETNKIIVLGKILGGHLAQASEGDPIKFNDWARSLYTGSPINVDKADFNTIKNFITAHKQFTNALKAQLLEKLSDAENAKDKKE